MNGRNFRNGRKYDREMEQAFILIYHNIKRLQDGRVHERATSRGSFVVDQIDLSPTLRGLRTTADPLNGPAEGVLRRNTNHESNTRPKDSTPLSQQRKVSFADDYPSKDRTARKGHTRT